MDDVAIKWDTALFKAERNAETLSLEVELDQTPNGYWRSAFGEQVERQRKEIRGQGGWVVNHPSFSELSVVRVAPGEEEAVAAALEAMVAAANREAPKRRKTAEEERAQEESHQAELDEAARAATERLRSRGQG